MTTNLFVIQFFKRGENMTNPFVKAVRHRTKLKLAIIGPSGSGKTYGALALAKGLGGKVAVIDTENNSAGLYGDRFDFDTVSLAPPFTPSRYMELVAMAEQAGYETLIIDSLSQVWQGEGGVLEKKGQIDSRGGNQYANWKVPKAEHNKLKERILQSNINIITTIKAKQGYALVDDNGKSKVQKLGLDPIAEPGVEYDYTVVFDVAMDHNAISSKDRTSIFDGKIFKITEKTGSELVSWLESGAIQPITNPQQAQPAQLVDVRIAPYMALRIHSTREALKAAKWTEEDAKAHLLKTYSKTVMGITDHQFNEFIGFLKNKDETSSYGDAGPLS
jgi:hypothetical protein